MFIPESQGWYQAGDFQVAHYVARRQSQKVGIATFTVQVSGTSVELLETTPLVPRASFEESLDLLAECGIGDHLDQLNANLEAGGPVQEVVCQTSYVQDLMKRAPVPDAIAIDYIVSKTYWSKKRSGVAIVSGRLELRPERLHRPFRFEARAASAGPAGASKARLPRGIPRPVCFVSRGFTSGGRCLRRWRMLCRNLWRAGVWKRRSPNRPALRCIRGPGDTLHLDSSAVDPATPRMLPRCTLPL
jgi:hypothetical protein